MNKLKKLDTNGWVACENCGHAKAEYIWSKSNWDTRIICEDCAEYLYSKGIVAGYDEYHHD